MRSRAKEQQRVQLAVAAVIDTYVMARVPVAVREEIHSFARPIVRRACPPDAKRAAQWMWTLGLLAVWMLKVGYPLTVDIALDERTIDRFIETGMTGYRASTRATARSCLRRIARNQSAYPNALPTLLATKRLSDPYSRDEVDQLLDAARKQPSALLRDRLLSLILLMVGAGLNGRELRSIRGRDIRRRDGVVYVRVSETRRIDIPMPAQYGEPLLEIARRHPDERLVASEGKNGVTNLAGTLVAGPSVPPLSARRLKSTWWIQNLERIGFAALVEAAGVNDTRRVFQSIPLLPRPTFTDLVEALTR